MKIYTVMAGCGVGEFLWISENESRLGGCLYSLMEADWVPEEMSLELFNDLIAWTRKYMKAMPMELFAPWPLDWDAFNEEGMQLARRLKQELGDTAAVRYMRADDDPQDVGEELLFLK